jgi:hypothetical protein
MPHASCAHCGVTITDHSTMVEDAGKAFCCNNCAAIATGQTASVALGTCAHCHAPIIDPSTKVERDDDVFCCNNCMAAMTAGAGQPQR